MRTWYAKGNPTLAESVFAGLIAGLSQHLKNATPLSTAR
jgi:hypothetical protein